MPITWPEGCANFVLKSRPKVTNVHQQFSCKQCRSCGSCCSQRLSFILDHSETESQLHLLLSHEAVSLGNSSKPLKFLGSLQGHSVVILVDSGSSYSFVKVKMVPLLQGSSPMPKPVNVQVANGQILQWYAEYKKVVWSI
jgi:hypothetical protein